MPSKLHINHNILRKLKVQKPKNSQKQNLELKNNKSIMGNSLGGKKRNKTTKVMKINGETMKLKTPIKAGEVMKDYPAGFALLESESVKHYGIRAKALEPHQDLLPKRLYFLVELPKPPAEKSTRRVRSGINMSAKDRLESLMLARRSTSDLSIMKPAGFGAQVYQDEEQRESTTRKRVTMRLPKAEVEKLMQESRDEDEAASKIVDLCMANRSKNVDHVFGKEPVHWKSGQGVMMNQRDKRRVSFLPVSEAEMQIAVASY